MIFISYLNEKVSLLKKKTNLILNLFSDIILIIKITNALLANINKIFSIAYLDYIFLKILLFINLVLSLSLVLMLLQSLNN